MRKPGTALFSVHRFVPALARHAYSPCCAARRGNQNPSSREAKRREGLKPYGTPVTADTAAPALAPTSFPLVPWFL
jgi:hypothetical protein